MKTNSILSEFGDEEFQIELVQTFIAESREHLEDFENSLLLIEKSQDTEDNIFKAMRAAHSLKGSASMLGFNEISDFAHRVEDLLSFIRESKTNITEEILDVLYHSKDILFSMIDTLKKDSDQDYEKETKNISEKIEKITESTKGIKIEENKIAKSENKILKKTVIKEKESIRVSVEKINNLINLSMETTLNFINLTNRIKGKLNIDEGYLFDELQKMILKLQEESIKVRMRELNFIASKYKRMVRDLARSKNKEIELEVEGSDTEVDKMILEKIDDPLKHMIRNSIDHGIELPGEREKLKKPRYGTIKIKAYYFNGQVRIELSDDGRGLDKDALLSKAIENGTIKDNTKLNEKEIYNLIFIPGFSTAENVSETSGRGVGMDVVKKNIESIYGSINIETKKGEGTKFIMDIPLTLSIIDGTYIDINGSVYAISNNEIVEFVRAKDIKKVKTYKTKDTVFYNDHIIPVIELSEYFNFKRNKKDYEFIAIVNGGEEFGIYIDKPLESTQLMIKSIEKNYKRINGLLGTSVYKDGSLAPILDIRVLTQNYISNLEKEV